MGNFEKLVVLTVVFLSAIVLAVSLNQDGSEVEAGSPYDAALAHLRESQEAQSEGAGAPGSVATPTEPRPSTTRGRSPGYFLDAGTSGPEEPGAETDAVEGAKGSGAGLAPSGAEAGPILKTSQELTPSLLSDYMIYEVSADDTWTELSSRFYDDPRFVKNLQLANEDVETLTPGQTILVPVYDFSREAGGRPSLAPRSLDAPGDATEPPRSATPEPEAAAPGARFVAATTYTIETGDSLSVISEKVYGTSTRWKAIFEANRDKLESPDWLRVGVELDIPSASIAQRPAAPATARATEPKSVERPVERKDGPRVR